MKKDPRVYLAQILERIERILKLQHLKFAVKPEQKETDVKLDLSE
jgi:uncharacterized protein with HEPN domain